jgi:hypothetical protein
MRQFAVVCFFCCLSFIPGSKELATAQAPAVVQIPRGSRVVIAPMGGFETYFAAAVRKKEVPITLTLDKSSAQYFVVSTETEWQGFVYGSASGGSWNRGGGSIWGGSSGSSTRGLEASIMLIDAKSKDVIWAYEVHKSSHGALLIGTLAARGKQSVAEACAKHLREFIEKSAKDGGSAGQETHQATGEHAVVAANPSQSQQPALPSSVSVSSTPPGAEIYVDQDFVGSTPSTINVQPGKHSVAVKKTGFQDWVKDMTFSGGNISLNAELLTGSTSASTQPAKKEFTVTQVPPSAEAPAADSHQGWIGIATRYIGPSSALITGVAPGGPAARAGLKAGDIITAINGVQLKDEDLDAKIAAYKFGSKVRIGYMRESWALEATVTVSFNTY